MFYLCVVVVQFNMPIEVTWEVMDTQLLQRFWSGHPRLRRGTAHLQERVMVFHRGIHTVSPPPPPPPLHKVHAYQHSQFLSPPYKVRAYTHSQSSPLQQQAVSELLKQVTVFHRGICTQKLCLP